MVGIIKSLDGHLVDYFSFAQFFSARGLHGGMDVGTQPSFVVPQTRYVQTLAAICFEQRSWRGRSGGRTGLGRARRKNAYLHGLGGGLRLFAMGIFQSLARLKMP